VSISFRRINEQYSGIIGVIVSSDKGVGQEDWDAKEYFEYNKGLYEALELRIGSYGTTN